MDIVLTGFCGYVALAVIVFCIIYTMVRAGMDLHDAWVLRKWKKNNKDKHQLIDDACEWLRENIYHRVYECGDRLGYPTADFLKDFRKAMED